jgi:anti-anti-sigma regulatory factor
MTDAEDARRRAAFRQLRLRWSVDDHAPVVHLLGDVDANARIDLDAIAVVADGVPRLVVDLADIHFVDVVGLDLIESLAQRTSVTVREPSPAVRRVLERTADVVDDWPLLRDALGSEG